MTPRVDVEWIDANDDIAELRRRICQCGHAQLLVGKGTIDEPIGMVLKKDLLDQILDGQAIDPLAAMRQPIALHETMPIFRVLEEFKSAPVRLATILDEYGVLQGIVTQTDLLEAIAGELPEIEGEEPGMVEREDGSLLIDGMMPAQEAFDRLGFKVRPEGDFHTPWPGLPFLPRATCRRSANVSTTRVGNLISSIWMAAGSTRSCN